MNDESDDAVITGISWHDVHDLMALKDGLKNWLGHTYGAWIYIYRSRVYLVQVDAHGNELAKKKFDSVADMLDFVIRGIGDDDGTE